MTEGEKKITSTIDTVPQTAEDAERLLRGIIELQFQDILAKLPETDPHMVDVVTPERRDQLLERIFKAVATDEAYLAKKIALLNATEPNYQQTMTDGSALVVSSDDTRGEEALAQELLETLNRAIIFAIQHLRIANFNFVTKKQF